MSNLKETLSYPPATTEAQVHDLLTMMVDKAQRDWPKASIELDAGDVPGAWTVNVGVPPKTFAIKATDVREHNHVRIEMEVANPMVAMFVPTLTRKILASWKAALAESFP